MDGTSVAKTWEQIWTGDTFATTLLVAFVDLYGTEGLNWHPGTILLSVQEDFGYNLPQRNYDRLMAAIGLVTSDEFFRSLPTFIEICRVLAGDLYDPTVFEPAEADQLAWGVTEALLIAPPEDENPFSDEIRAYIGAALDEEGIIAVPEVLRMAVRMEDVGLKVHDTFSEDPELFGAIYEVDRQKTEAIDKTVWFGLSQIAEQLRKLPLKDGSANEFAQKIEDAVRESGAAA